MKKIITLILTLAMILTVVTGCSTANKTYTQEEINQKIAAGVKAALATANINNADQTNAPATTTVAPAANNTNTAATVAPATQAAANASAATNAAAVSSDGKYVLQDPDHTQMNVDLSKAIGFTPDKDLLVSKLYSKMPILGQDKYNTASNWDQYLNTKSTNFGPLAGFTNSINDFCQYYNNQCSPQLPAFSWLIHTGYTISMPGIGTLQGSSDQGKNARAVAVLVINRTNRVFRFPTNSVTVVAGFQGWGRILNGDEGPSIETEKRLINHFLTRLGNGVPEKGFIGQGDGGYDNASTVTVVTLQYTQWGTEKDGSPRYQFQLLRAETVPTIKPK